MSRPAGRRRRGRELALRVLFELEGTAKDPRSTLAYQATEMGVPADAIAFAGTLVEGTLEHVVRIDAAIGEASDNWDLVDFGKVERAVLRLGTFEVLFEPATPIAVSIDESLELTRVYAGDEAVPLVNGVLGRIARERV
ncbi:MAG: transcription antitermination factor NusB [Candidatus Dormiibacterota bacterium]|jgi:N utilization substance protein B